MAPSGHSSMHSPQPSQLSSFTTEATLPTMSSTPLGQVSTQIPHPEHSSMSIVGWGMCKPFVSVTSRMQNSGNPSIRQHVFSSIPRRLVVDRLFVNDAKKHGLVTPQMAISRTLCHVWRSLPCSSWHPAVSDPASLATGPRKWSATPHPWQERREHIAGEGGYGAGEGGYGADKHKKPTVKLRISKCYILVTGVINSL